MYTIHSPVVIYAIYNISQLHMYKNMYIKYVKYKHMHGKIFQYIKINNLLSALHINA